LQNKPNCAFACNTRKRKQSQSNPIFWLSPCVASRRSRSRLSPPVTCRMAVGRSLVEVR
jgi:hypothetical protein